MSSDVCPKSLSPLGENVDGGLQTRISFVFISVHSWLK
jgi:hypothetical protein